MKDIYELVQEHEAKLEDFLNWQIEHGPTNDFRNYAELNSNAESVFKYAAILYPKFIEVEDNIVLADHYSDENWEAWRKKLDSRDAANIVNHVHLEDYLTNDYQGVQKIEAGLGELLAFFWQLAVKHQFPSYKVMVEYNGDVINVLNQ